MGLNFFIAMRKKLLRYQLGHCNNSSVMRIY